MAEKPEPPRPKWLDTSGSKTLDWLINMLSGKAFTPPKPPRDPRK
ncbi:hypothetical protein [Lacticaseibacillus nasuensis]|nr:hypothetical protein [Lacticaseibacillus nasuensis]